MSVSFCKVLISSVKKELELNTDDCEMVEVSGGFAKHAKLIKDLSKGKYTLIERDGVWVIIVSVSAI